MSWKEKEAFLFQMQHNPDTEKHTMRLELEITEEEFERFKRFLGKKIDIQHR